MTLPRWLAAALVLSSALGACGGPAPVTRPPSASTTPELGRRRTDLPSACEQQPGKPPPEPLRIPYTGLAQAARCQDEVFSIMGGVTHFLGVPCKYCHLEPDYAADTHNKQVANWMARELVPRLKKHVAERGDSATWCRDCHAGKPKLLGNPRSRELAIDWMTTHLSERFDTLAGKPPKCKECHGGDVGSPEFRARLILGELARLPGPPPAAASSGALSAEPAPPGAAPSAMPEPPPSAAPAEPLPDFGRR